VANEIASDPYFLVSPEARPIATSTVFV